MRIFRCKLGGLILCAVIMNLLASCSERSSHCFLCQSIPYEAPCLVDLSTGDIAPLTIRENNDAVSFQILGDVRIEQRTWETYATIPAEPKLVNTDLFCESCQELIEDTLNTGCVLADLSSLSSIQLYPIEAGETITIRGYNISIVGDNDHIQIQVAAPMEK